MDNSISVFTDGGCSGNPGPGGWAYVVLKDGEIVTYGSGADENTTNNVMELTAVINAVKTCQLLDYQSFTLYTDSQYVKNGITLWIENWKKNGWRTSSKDPVKNRELWEELDSVCSRSEINWAWVKGHSGVAYNEMCDSLVRNEIKNVNRS